MARTVLLLVTGAIVGGAAVYLIAGRAPEPAGSGLSTSAEVQSNPRGTPGTNDVAAVDAVSSGAIVSARVATYQRALEATDVIDLESMIELTASAPRSRARDLDLAALMARLAELDPGRAVAFARSAYLDTPLLIQAFQALARVDTAAAVAGLASVAPAATQRRVAFALLDVVGLNDDGIERIATALPDYARQSFELDALLARARIDPAGVMREVVSRNGVALQSYILPRLAEVAVEGDPAAALVLGDFIEDYNFRLAYGNAVLAAWAELDPEAVFAFLEIAEPADLSMSADAFAALARYDSDRLLAMVEQLPPAVRTNARRAAMQSLAERDPEAALALLDTMSPGQDRDSMLSTIAQTYGRRNPEFAMAWVKTLSPPSPAAMQGVLQGIAAVDSDRAIDLFIEEIENQTSQPNTSTLPSTLLLPMIFSSMASSGTDPSRLADRILALDNPQLRSQLSVAISIWATRDGDAALSWTLANVDRLDPFALRNVAQRMATDDLDLALSTLDRLPPSHRGGWVEGVASLMAQTDIDRARDFLEQLRGQPGYEQAYGVVAQSMAQRDPAAAARMLDEAPASSALQSASFTVAREWANRDPAAAARWALDLDDAQLQRNAISNIASVWAQRDAAAAERWLLALSRGPGRDAAADGYIGAAAQVGRFEPRLLEAYSSAAARQRGASRAAVAIARTDPVEAKRVLDTYVTDPAIRAQAEEQLTRTSGAGSAAFISNGVIFTQ